jgi:hypothetical protein
MSEMVEWADDDGSAAHEPVSPTFHDFGVRVPPGADYVTESGQRFENWSDRVMEFEASATGLRPALEHAGKDYHWIQRRDEPPEPYFFYAGRWMVHGSGEITSATDMAAQGWRYLGPAEWNPVAVDVAKRLAVGAGAYHALSVANVRIAALEADNADLTTLLAVERDRVAALLSSVSRETPFAAHAEAELVERAMPANALRHSR